MSSSILLDYTYVTPGRMVATCVLFPLLTIIIVTLRFCSRLSHKSPLKSDDWLILISTAFNVGLGIAFLFGVAQHAVGYPLQGRIIKAPEAYYPPQYVLILQLEYAMFALQTLTLAFTKLSVLMFYRRCFVTGAERDWFSFFSLFMLAMCTLWGTGFFLSVIFNCGSHFSDYWSPGQPHCLPYDSRPLGYAISDFITDFIILCMPMGIVWSLHLKTKRKLIVTALFLVGAIAVIASLVRMVIFIIVLVKPAQEQKVDVAFFYSVIFFWTIVESSASIVAACLPTLHLLPLSRAFIARARSILNLPPLQTLHSRSRSRSRTWERKGSSTKTLDIEHGDKTQLRSPVSALLAVPEVAERERRERGVRTYKETFEMAPWADGGSPDLGEGKKGTAMSFV